MAITPSKPIVTAFRLTTAWQNVYEVGTSFSRVLLDKITVSNYSSNNVTYSVRIVEAEPSTIEGEIITDKKVKSKRADLAPELTVHALASGTKLQVKASDNDALNINITATQIS